MKWRRQKRKTPDYFEMNPKKQNNPVSVEIAYKFMEIFLLTLRFFECLFRGSGTMIPKQIIEDSATKEDKKLLDGQQMIQTYSNFSLL